MSGKFRVPITFANSIPLHSSKVAITNEQSLAHGYQPKSIGHTKSYSWASSII